MNKKTIKENGEIVQENFTLFSDYDIELFRSGKHFQLYNFLGAHIVDRENVKGTYFSVWAPNAKFVSVIGNFNGWNTNAHSMFPRWDSSGIWEVFVPGLKKAEYYKYYIESVNGYSVSKSDPYGFYCEHPPFTASIVWDLDYAWSDLEWVKKRNYSPAHPMSIYEMHIGSWRRGDDGRFLSYAELATELPAYCKYMGFTHVEFMPVMEHPFYGSWGYQLTGYYAPSSRFGLPQDFMFLINELHKSNIGVILDWVPSHFPTDEHGLGFFDGTHLYEYGDQQKGFHPDWKSFIFNYDRNEVREFLISNAMFWLDKYHIDGLRVDAVASMLYLDYSRNEGQWSPNIYGGRENIEAIGFLKEFNDTIHHHHPGVVTIAEESTAWPGVTHATEQGGLGFDLKWMMGWMHDTLSYFQKNPVYRSYNQDMITFSMHYAFTESFVLPLSHDEVVYGKHSLINKMPGDEWQQFANLRLLYAYMYGHPGAKLIFMGGEFGQRHEWQHDYSLDWHENLSNLHSGIQQCLKALNEMYKNEPALHQFNYDDRGFEWIDISDSSNSVISWIRKCDRPDDNLIFVANFTPVVRENYRIGVPARGYYKEIFNSDRWEFGGSNVLSDSNLFTAPISRHGKEQSLSLFLPPLGILVLKKSGGALI